jgi:hypothetical protein
MTETGAGHGFDDFHGRPLTAWYLPLDLDEYLAELAEDGPLSPIEIEDATAFHAEYRQAWRAARRAATRAAALRRM